jgi:signal peptidase I
MNGVPLDDRNRRLPWLAALLSFIMVGLGQVYAGRLVRGLIFSSAFSVAISVSILFLAFAGPLPTVTFGLLAVVASLGLTLAGVLDAYWVAARTRPDYELQAYNQPVVYLLLGLLVMSNGLGFALHVRSSLFQAFRVSAASMRPTIGVNDRILVDKTAYRRTQPQRGDIVVFHPPTGDWRNHHIKRVIALGGDTVSMRNGDLYVNGQPLRRERVWPDAQGQNTGPTPPAAIHQEQNGTARYRILLSARAPQEQLDFAEITVPAHYCFVLGDNRSESADSRQFGPIPYAVIVGRADYVYWPARDWSRFGRLE